VLGSIHVARAAKVSGARRVVNFQTALAYGRPKQVPIPIDHPTQPFTSYGISKTAGEQFMVLAGLPLVSLRLANICGPRLAIGPIPTFYKRLKEQKGCFCSDSTRDFLDMEDFFSLMDLVLVDGAPTGTFNVSTGEGRSIHDIYVAVAAHLGIEPPPVKIVPVGADDVPAVVLDPSHTEKTFGWRANSDFQATIKRQLQWYDQHGVTDIFSHLAPAKS
jgi:UDP-glucose 4-epimerase